MPLLRSCRLQCAYAKLVLARTAARFSWCFGYEAKNQNIKRAAQMSNYKDVAATVVKYISMQHARKLKTGYMSSWMQVCRRLCN